MEKNIIKWCCEKQIQPLYTDIDKFNYNEPIMRLANDNKYLKKYIPKNNEVNDMSMQYYIKSMHDISLIIIYPNGIKMQEQLDTVMKMLKDKGDIHYIKDININYYASYNLVFQLYANEKRMKSNSTILYKINRLGFKSEMNDNPVKVIVYSLNEKSKKEGINISGSSASFKMELRDVFVKEAIKTTPFESTDDRYPRGYDYLHVSDNDNQAYEYASIFFHENSLKFLEKQKSWGLHDMSKARKNFNRIKEFMYGYSMVELEKLLLNSSVVLFTHGIREANDIDGILIENDKIEAEKITKLNEDEKIDISYRPLFNDMWENELNKRAKLVGAENYHELIMNPKYYYYFMGIKILRLKYEIIIRSIRQRPAQLTDLLIIRQMFKLNYQLEIPKTTKRYDEVNKVDIYENVDRKKYLETMQFYLKTRYLINLKIEQIDEWLKQTYENNNDPYFSDQEGGSSESQYKYIDILENQADEKYVYPSQDEIIKMGYAPNIRIYSSDKPYLYEGEGFYIKDRCIIDKESFVYEKKNAALRVLTFNVHNFISRCNQGIAPLFGTALNPFEIPKDINRFINFFKKMNADVVCLQEIVPVYKKFIEEDITDIEYIRNNFNFNYFNELMENIGYKYKIISSTQRGKFLKLENNDYYYLANAIYSKVKIDSYNIYGYSFLNRNIIKANINWRGKNISIYNTQWEYFNDESKIIKENPLVMQSESFFNILKEDKNNKILCGDFNINLYKKGITPRYFKWDERTQYLRNEFINTNKSKIPTNFSQMDETDYILMNKNSNLKVIYSLTIKTNISDHYGVLTDFI